MEKPTAPNQQTSPLLFNHSALSTAANDDASPRKPHPATAAADRLKRDEWSEGAVSTLLEEYESKWVLRNRAKLKGHDWEDIAHHVSSRSNFSKSPKTQTQCKNKIESMKKRYRSESASAVDAVSSWPLYHRLDLLLRGSTLPPPPPQVLSQSQSPSPPLLPTPLLATAGNNPPVMLMEASLSAPPPPSAPPPFVAAQNSHGSNGVDRIPKEDRVETRLSDHLSDKNDNNNIAETDSSTPAILYSDKEKLTRSKQHQHQHPKMKKGKKKKRMSEELDQIAGSIRWLAEVVVRSEQARMDMIRDIERMRAEAEAKRGEMDLKRTEIIANTQLEIAKLFAAGGKGVDSSLRIGRS